MNQFYENDETILDEISTLSDLVNYQKIGNDDMYFQ